MASKCGGDTMHEQVHDRQKDDLTATLVQAALSLHGVVVTILRVVSCAFCSDLSAASLDPARLQIAPCQRHTRIRSLCYKPGCCVRRWASLAWSASFLLIMYVPQSNAIMTPDTRPVPNVLL